MLLALHCRAPADRLWSVSARGDKARREAVDQFDERGDAPDPAAVPAAAVLALQRGAGNQATAALIARMRRPRAEVSARTLQRRWLFAERPYFFFWDDDGTQMDEEELGAPEFRSIQWRSTLGDAPPIPPYVVELKSYKELVERPEPGVPGGSRAASAISAKRSRAISGSRTAGSGGGRGMATRTRLR